MMLGATVLKNTDLSDQIPAAKTQAELVKLVGHFCELASYFPAALLLV